MALTPHILKGGCVRIPVRFCEKANCIRIPMIIMKDKICVRIPISILKRHNCVRIPMSVLTRILCEDTHVGFEKRTASGYPCGVSKH